MPKHIAVVSVTNKSGLIQLKRLVLSGKWEIVSTSGTSEELQELGISTTPIKDYTGAPKGMDGKLETLHHVIHGGIAGNRSKSAHTDHGIPPIDLVIVDLDESIGTIDDIDIGKLDLLRSAVTNAAVVLVDPDDYEYIIDLFLNDGVDDSTRADLAMKAFKVMMDFDNEFMRWLEKEFDEGHNPFAIPIPPAVH
jgi:phosphoribosylaminoimidazolecarboxamide formyltransferase/IMP cyclohydrolase